MNTVHRHTFVNQRCSVCGLPERDSSTVSVEDRLLELRKLLRSVDDRMEMTQNLLILAIAISAISFVVAVLK